MQAHRSLESAKSGVMSHRGELQLSNFIEKHGELRS
jgi:hypothetical protein